MKRQTRKVETELAVIGAGIAGFAASIYALRRGIKVAQFGHTGAIAYTTGYLDLLGVQDQKVLDDPWAGLEALRHKWPQHPLCYLADSEIRTAFDIFTEALSEMGLGYTKPSGQNLRGLLPYGVTKPTLSVPDTMYPGIEAKRAKAKTLIVDFAGLQGFSAQEFKVNMGADWPGLEAIRLQFPDMENQQLYPEVMARALETPDARAKLAALIRPALNGAEYVGLPAILGMQNPAAILAEMSRLIGAKLFEIPTMPPAVPGIRLREMFERELPKRGLALESQLKVSRVAFHENGVTLFLKGAMEDLEVEAQAVILASGRFLSGGLRSSQNHLSESLLGLPVSQPQGRDSWYRQDYLDPQGHPINRAGVGVDRSFRPVGPNAKPVNARLFAAGAILANQDWVRQRCGVGLAIASAYGAVRAASESFSLKK